jgi:putative transposase
MLRTADPLTSMCRVLGLPRRTRDYRAQPRHDQPVRQAIEAVAQQFPTYGTRRVAAQVRRAPYRLLVNRQRARRVMRDLGLLRRRRPHRRWTTNRQQAVGASPIWW